MPANRPLLLLPIPTSATRLRPPGGGSEVVFPNHQRQGQRLGNTFSTLEASFRRDHAQLSTSVDGIEPEHVIIFETIGTIDEFYKAVKEIDGLQWLVEFDGDEIEEDEDFHRSEQDDEEINHLSRRLYLVMSNRQGMTELLSLWRAYLQDGVAAVVGRGKAKWKHLFKQLYDVRLWNVNDRLLATGLREDWEFRVAEGQESINVEIELWYRSQPADRVEAQARVVAAINESGGQLLSSCLIDHVRYHALLASMPITNVESMFQNSASIQLALADQVMFFRPASQSIIRIESPSEEIAEDPSRQSTTPDSTVPYVAMLDGVPLENHTWIRNYILVDDPDGISERVEARHRFHGTAMASLILNGDGELAAELKRPIYVRPIMTARSSVGHTTEVIPENRLAVDVIHQSLVRMFLGEQGEAPVTPQVKVINLSIGERYRPFVHYMSPLSRILDWLSYEFNVLFVVSAGNYPSELTIPLPSQSIESLPIGSRQQHAMQALTRETMTKKILSPAESINALTVGSANADNSSFQEGIGQISLLESNQIVNVYSAFGLGFRNSVKPDILAPGGRSLFMAHSSGPSQSIYRPVVSTTRVPGQKVASPAGTSGGLSGYNYSVGTSNSAALVTRLAGKIIELLNNFSVDSSLDSIPEEYWSCLTKALVVHGASWQNAKEIFRALAPADMDSGRLKNWITRFLGYGLIEEEKSLFCDTHRATAISYGSLSADTAHVFEFPLPNGLSGVRTMRRLVVTLAWLSPIDPFNRKYRKAQLWFSNEGKNAEDPLLVRRAEVDWRTTRRGTVQHEIFEGSDIATFVSDEALKITISCKADAGKLEEQIRYGLAITLESADKTVVTVYDEVRAAIQARSRIQTR